MPIGAVFLANIHSNIHLQYHYYFYYPTSIDYYDVVGTNPVPTTIAGFHFFIVIFGFQPFQLLLMVIANKNPNDFYFYNLTNYKDR